MIALRKRHPILRRQRFLEDGSILWHGTQPFKPDFGGVSRTVAFSLDGRKTGRELDRDFYIACNAWSAPLWFTIPPSPQGKLWRRVVDTSLASPNDIVGLDQGPAVPAGIRYNVGGFSLIVLIAEA
jgi:pullulanase/glycogen debranching enzyme